jgi:hypothetical protein
MDISCARKFFFFPVIEPQSSSLYRGILVGYNNTLLAFDIIHLNDNPSGSHNFLIHTITSKAQFQMVLESKDN